MDIMILRNLNFIKFEVINKIIIINIVNIRNIFFYRKNLKFTIPIFLILLHNYFQKQLLSDVKSIKFNDEKIDIKWKRSQGEKNYKNEVIWKKIQNNKDIFLPTKDVKEYQDFFKNDYENISSFNRSIVFNNSIVGPDISWLVPPGF